MKYLASLALLACLFIASCGGGNMSSLQQIKLTPQTPNEPVGKTIAFALDGRYRDGTVQSISSGITWTSSNTVIATIGADGKAFGAEQGETTISASYGGFTETTVLSVTVLP